MKSLSKTRKLVTVALTAVALATTVLATSASARTVCTWNGYWNKYICVSN
jgi:hypothetical protein